MTTSNLPAHRETGLQIATIDEAMRYCEAVSAAGLAPDSFRGKPANVFIAREIATELDESVWTVMSEMSVIGGKPSFSAKFMRSRVRQAGHRLRESFDKDTGTARAVILRHDDPDFEHVAEWDRKKAEDHGLWGKGHWKKNPELMLKNRALSECVREACYEVMGGVAYTPDEVMDFAEPSPVRAEATRPHPKQQPVSGDSTPRSREEIADELADIDSLTVDRTRAIWREARAAGYTDMLDDITGIAELLSTPKDEAPPTEDGEVMDGELV